MIFQITGHKITKRDIKTPGDTMMEMFLTPVKLIESKTKAMQLIENMGLSDLGGMFDNVIKNTDTVFEARIPIHISEWDHYHYQDGQRLLLTLEPLENTDTGGK